MNFLQMMLGLNGESMKQKLLQMGVSENDLQGVNFSDMNSLNQLAEKIVPTMLRNNPNMKNFVKQNSSFFWNRKDEVVEVVDKL